MAKCYFLIIIAPAVNHLPNCPIRFSAADPLSYHVSTLWASAQTDYISDYFLVNATYVKVILYNICLDITKNINMIYAINYDHSLLLPNWFHI